MRDFATFENLRRAAGLAVILTAMAVGRLVQVAVPLAVFVPATFLAMTFMSGAVFAWGRRAGMPGLTLDRRTLLPGACVAAALLVPAIPAYALWIDPLLRVALASAAHPVPLEMSFPSTTAGRFALMLWSAGFQTMFFVAAPMSFFARLTGRSWTSVACCVALRVYIVHRQIAETGIVTGVPVFIASAVVTTLVACVLFRRYGLVPVMLFAGGLDLRAFF